MDNWDIFYSIEAPAEGVYKDKGSRFIAYAFPVSTENQVKPLLDALKKEHHSARHHCYAYKLGYDGAVFRANDDGEPSGSAGKPILGVLDSLGLTDVLVVVVRYFGGILLGVPGLIRAYREASASALEAAAIVQKVAAKRFRLEFDYAESEIVSRMVKADGSEVVARDFALKCTMDVDVRLSKSDDFEQKIKNVNNEKGTRIQCRSLQIAI